MCLSFSATRQAHVTSRTLRDWERGCDELMAHESTILISRSCQDSEACGNGGHVERKWPANDARHPDMRSPTLQGRVTEHVEITRPESTALFWVITQRVIVISYRRFDTTYRSHLQPTRCPEMSVRNYHYSLCNSPEERNSLWQRFSNFFQVGTTFISQNVLRTTLLLGLSNSLGLP